MNLDFGRLIRCCSLILLLLSGSAWGLKTDSDQPIYLEADSADIDDANNRSIYSGNVIVTQGTIRLTGDKVIVIQKPEGKGGDQFYASGNPSTFRQEIEGKPGEFVRGKAKKIEYQSDSELLFLIDGAHLTQEGDSFSSDRITYDREKSILKGGSAAKGKQRIHMTMQPKKDEAP